MVSKLEDHKETIPPKSLSGVQDKQLVWVILFVPNKTKL